MADQYTKRGYLLEDFRLFHLKDEPKSEIGFHYHEFHKILLLLSGSGNYSVDGTRYAMKPGQMILVGSHRIHRPEFEENYERIILYISPEFLRQASTANYSLEHCFTGEEGHLFPISDNIKALAAELEHELSANAPGSDIAAKGLILKLLVEIGRTQRNHFAAPSPLPLKNRRISMLLRYIEEHISEELSIDVLAEQAFLSKYHLMRLFREETGTTIHGYILDRRLLLAKTLIASGSNATNACFQAGFKSYSSFTRAYAKRFGTTPTGRTDRIRLAEETFE